MKTLLLAAATVMTISAGGAFAASRSDQQPAQYSGNSQVAASTTYQTNERVAPSTTYQQGTDTSDESSAHGDGE